MATKRTISPLAQYIAQLQGGLGKNMGYDAQLAAAIQGAQLGKSDLDRAFGAATGEAKTAYEEMARQLQEQKVEGYEANEGQFSGNGLLRSGIFAGAQGEVGERYQEGITNAVKRRVGTVQGATDARLSGYNQIQAGLAGAQGAASARGAEAARQREMQRIQQQQQQSLLDIQRQGIAQQTSVANQQLQLYRDQIRRTGTGSTMPQQRTMLNQTPQPSAQSIMRRNASRSWIGGGSSGPQNAPLGGH